MDRKELNSYTLAQLQQEARKFGIVIKLKKKEECVEAILQHLEENGPLLEMRNISNPQEAIGEAQSPGPSAQVFTKNRVQNNASDHFQTAKTDDMPHFCSMMQESIQKQQEMINQLITALTINQRPPQVQSQHFSAETTSRDTDPQERFSAMAGNAVKFLSSQIPHFNGTEDENIKLWVEKIESVAQLHNLSSVVMLSAAAYKLSKTARKWFDLSTGSINESWFSFKEEIIDRFRRKVLFNEVIQKVNSRKWIFSKESFQEYAMDKLALMRSLKLTDEDSIQLLITGIGSFALRTTAAALKTKSLNQFLREMQHITSTSGNTVNKSPTMKSKFGKFKDGSNNQQSGRSDNKEEHRVEPNKERYCTYCHKKNHSRVECFKLKKKETERKSQLNQPTTTTVSAVKEADKYTDNTVAIVTSTDNRTILTDNSVVNIISINNANSMISALLDTGSPISFIGYKTFYKFFDSNVLLNSSEKSYKALNGKPIKIIGTISTSIILEALPIVEADILFYILNDDTFSGQVILGRDFLINNKISCIFNCSKGKENERLKFFAEVASANVLEDQSNDLMNILSNINIDFDEDTKKQLITTILEVENTNVAPADDDYFVKVKLKDDYIQI